MGATRRKKVYKNSEFDLSISEVKTRFCVLITTLLLVGIVLFVSVST